MKEKKTEVVTFRTTPEIKKYLEDAAEKEERTPAWIAEKIIKEFIKTKKTEKNVQFNINHTENINL